MYFFTCTTTRRCGNLYHNDGDSTHDDNDDSENDHRKIDSDKKIPHQNRGQNLKFSHGKLK